MVRLHLRMQLPLFNMKIELIDTSVKIGNKIILESIHYKMIPQSFIHLKGDNGSGKTVFMQTLLGFYKCIGKCELSLPKKETVYIPDTPFFNENTSVKEIIHTYRYFFNVSTEMIHDCLNTLEFNHSLNMKTASLSLGTKKKLEILPLFFPMRKIYFLDEITLGLDSKSTRLVIDRIVALHKLGSTFIMSEHNPKIIEALSQHIEIKELICHNKKIVQSS